MDAGDQFESYVLDERIGEGGMAAVFRARRVGADGFSRRVCVKFIHDEVAHDEMQRRLFLDEARVGALLRHPNIVAIEDFGYVGERLYLCMEFVDGTDLRAVLDALASARRTAPIAFVLHVLRGLLAALDYVHRKLDPNGSPLRLVHRDVSPDNTMIARDGTVKLTDFGVASAAIQLHRTEAGMVKGKPLYMSPEHMVGRTLDGRADLYAVGVIAYELLAGHRPFEAESTAQAIAMALAGEPYVPVSVARPDTPADLAGLVTWLLERNRERRCASAADALARLPQPSAAADEETAALVEIGRAHRSSQRHDAPAPPADQPTRAERRRRSDGTPPTLAGSTRESTVARIDDAPSPIAAPARVEDPRPPIAAPPRADAVRTMRANVGAVRSPLPWIVLAGLVVGTGLGVLYFALR